MKIREIMRRVGWRKGLKTLNAKDPFRYKRNRLTIITAKRVTLPQTLEGYWAYQIETKEPLDLS